MTTNNAEPDAPSESEETFSPAYRNYVLFLLLAVYTSNYIDRQILAGLLEPIKEEFQLRDATLGLLTGGVFALFYATLGIPFAMWADRGNRRNIITLALTIWSGMTALCGTAGNIWQLFIFRVGVGVGEAGSSPPSHSIIADLFPPEKRATAMAIFAMGVNIGILFGFFIAGRIYEFFGDWRPAFFIVGLPGLMLALLVRYTLREPPRGLSEKRVLDSVEAPPFITVVKFMLSQPAMVHLLIGCSLVVTFGYCFVSWGTSFFIRSHHMSLGDATMAMGLFLGIAGAIGTFSAGWAADHFSKKDIRWMSWSVAVLIGASWPFTVAVLLVDSTALALFLFTFTAFAGAAYLGPSFAMTQGLVGVKMRALAAAFLLFTVNFIGYMIGPFVAGLLSDYYATKYGDESLRWALLTISVVNVWAVVHYYIAGKHLQAGFERAKDL